MHTPNGPRLERIHVGVYVDDLATVYLHDDEHSLYRSFISALEARWNVEDDLRPLSLPKKPDPPSWRRLVGR